MRKCCMKKRREAFLRLPVLLLTMLLIMPALLLGACGSGEVSRNEKPTVALITKSTKSSFWKNVYAGAGAAATEYNVNITFQGPSTEEDYEAQNILIREAVEQGVDVIIFSAVDYNKNAEAIHEAAQKGVRIVVIDSDVNSDQVVCRIGTDNVEAGRLAGKAAMDNDYREIHIGIVNFDVNSANGQQREQGFREYVSGDERVKSIEVINVTSAVDASREGATALLREHPEINVVATFNEWTSLGVGWAIHDLKLGEKTRVVAFDAHVINVGMLETGEVDALIVQNPYAMGYLGVEAAARLIKEQAVKETHVDTAATIVTRENMFEPDTQKILFSFN